MDYAKVINVLRNCVESANGLNILAADAIEKLLAEKAKIENSGKLLAAAFERLKSKVPTWISVEERLPEDDKYVLCVDEGNVIMGFYVDECGWGDMDTFRIYPTHWMPLPEPPKGGNHDN